MFQGKMRTIHVPGARRTELAGHFTPVGCLHGPPCWRSRPDALTFRHADYLDKLVKLLNNPHGVIIAAIGRTSTPAMPNYREASMRAGCRSIIRSLPGAARLIL